VFDCLLEARHISKKKPQNYWLEYPLLRMARFAEKEAVKWASQATPEQIAKNAELRAAYVSLAGRHLLSRH
jgi:hypothetical protein